VQKLVSQQRNTTDYSQIIAENFGANATYVEGLLSRFRSDPSLVDEAWRSYFSELLGEGAAAQGGEGGSLHGLTPSTGQPTRRRTRPAAARA
jgi:2-oxoglutarate dehydrogenase complex dehydrogenase (E1) component-like enzyme